MNNIKHLYGQVKDKKLFISVIANEYKRSKESVATNWFSSWHIPDFANKEARIHEILINLLTAERDSLTQTIEEYE